MTLLRQQLIDEIQLRGFWGIEGSCFHTDSDRSKQLHGLVVLVDKLNQEAYKCLLTLGLSERLEDTWPFFAAGIGGFVLRIEFFKAPDSTNYVHHGGQGSCPVARMSTTVNICIGP
jgi:hypothetical protein